MTILKIIILIVVIIVLLVLRGLVDIFYPLFIQLANIIYPTIITILAVIVAPWLLEEYKQKKQKENDRKKIYNDLLSLLRKGERKNDLYKRLRRNPQEDFVFTVVEMKDLIEIFDKNESILSHKIQKIWEIAEKDEQNTKIFLAAGELRKDDTKLASLSRPLKINRDILSLVKQETTIEIEELKQRRKNE